MRIGTNPEKENFKKIQYKLHRVIIPVYIPDENYEYFKDLDKVFKENINSLLETIDAEKTNITIINNNSKKEVTDYIDNLLQNKLIDKHIKYGENYGKVYSILQEARASYEDYITIADADVFFFNDWQNQVHRVFNEFNKVGVVGLTPDPNTAFYCNASLFFKEWLFVKKGKIVENAELELFEAGINKKDFFVTKNKNWKKEQFYLEKNKVKVVVGAGHFASVYKKEVFKRLPFEKPICVFPGGEFSFLDKPIDQQGYYRVSLTKAFAYHMGNTIPSFILDISQKKTAIESIKITETNHSQRFSFYTFKSNFLRVLRKLNFYK